jgi:hypothetical protein
MDREDRAVAEALVGGVPAAELFLYPGWAHLFADPSSGDYDEEATALLRERPFAFLHRLDAVSRLVRHVGERESNNAERLSPGSHTLSSTIGICCQACSR